MSATALRRRDAERVDHGRAFDAYGAHVAISLTSRCPLRCAHCVADAGPERESHIDLADGALARFLQDLEADHEQGAVGIDFVTLTGGEAALRPDLVRMTTQTAARCGFTVGLMTSGYWAKSRAAADRFLARLGPIGMMTVSTDLEHLRFVELDWVRNAFDAAEDAGIPTFIRLTRAAEPIPEEEALEATLRAEFRERLQVQQLVPWGRGRDYAPARRDTARDALMPTLPCPSTGPHVLESGHVIPCCNTITAVAPRHPLVLGDLAESNYRAIEERSRSHLLLLYIRLFGFGPLLDAAIAAGFEVANDDISPCQICAEFMEDEALGHFVERWVARPENVLHICTALHDRFGDTIDLSAITARAAPPSPRRSWKREDAPPRTPTSPQPRASAASASPNSAPR